MWRDEEGENEEVLVLVLVPNSEVRSVEVSSCEARCFRRKFDGSSRERADDGEDGPPSSLGGDCNDELAGGVLSGEDMGGCDNVGDDVGDCGGVPSAASNLVLLGSRSLSLFGLAEDPLA